MDRMAAAAAPLVMFHAPLWLLPMAGLLLACPPSQHTEVRAPLRASHYATMKIDWYMVHLICYDAALHISMRNEAIYLSTSSRSQPLYASWNLPDADSEMSSISSLGTIASSRLPMSCGMRCGAAKGGARPLCRAAACCKRRAAAVRHISHSAAGASTGRPGGAARRQAGTRSRAGSAGERARIFVSPS